MSNLWEHCRVPEQRVPIWLLSGSVGKQCKHGKYWYFIRLIAILEIDFKMKVAKPLSYFCNVTQTFRLHDHIKTF